MDMMDKVQICKIVALAILSDARITDTEHAFLQGLMSSWKLCDDDREAVLNCNMDDDPKDLLWTLSSGEGEEELMSKLVQVVAVDGEISASERNLLVQVGDSLGLGEKQVDLMLGSVKP